jgi:hypothetical protein
MSKLEEYITINYKKSNFFRQEISFVGFIINREGIRPIPVKINAIHQFPKPNSKRQLRGFMGLINYYQRFAKRHAHKLANLTYLLKSASKWKWGSAENGSFNEIKLSFTKDMHAHKLANLTHLSGVVRR